MTVNKRKLVKPIITGIIYFLVLVCLIGGAIWYASNVYPKLDEIFQNSIIFVVIFGSVFAVFGAITAHYEKGDLLRMGYGVTKGVILIGYFIGIYYSLDISIEIEGITATITFPGIMILVIILLAINALYYVVEYFLYRDEEGGDEMVVSAEMGNQEKNEFS